MIIASLLAVMLSVPASAQVQACASNEMTSAWEKITLGLWLSDYTIPDSSPRTALLSYKGCSASGGRESRVYASEDGAYAVTALTNRGGEDGATTLSLSAGGGTAQLGTWSHHKVFYKGVGVDQVAVPSGALTVKKNVFVIPVAEAVKP